MKRLVLMCVMVMALVMLQACGSAQSPGGGNNDPGNGGGGGSNNNLAFVFSGFAVGEQPILDCFGAGFNWTDITLDASGKATAGFEWPDDVACNIHIGNKYIVTKDGMCGNYGLKVNGVVITTGANNTDNTGKNWKFHVSDNGTVTLVGDTLATYNCGTSGQVPLNIEFLGYTSGQTPKVSLAGDGLTWTAHQLDSNGKVTVNGDPATYVSNVEVTTGNWAVQPRGVWTGYTFKVNGVTINTGVPNGQGGYNYSFNLASNGTVTPNGSVLPTYSTSGGGSTVPLNIVFSGYATAQVPKFHCANAGFAWNTATTFDSQGRATLNALPDVPLCNIQFSDGSWAVTGQGVWIGYTLKVNNVLINTGTSNGSGGYNWSFTVNANGVVTPTGTILPVYSGSGGSVLMNITFSGYRAGLSPKLYCAGQNLIWDDILLDALGKAVVSVNPGNPECNVEVEPGVWAVNSGRVWDGYSFTVNGFRITTGSSNYQFQINSSGVVSGYGSSLTTFSLSLYNVKFVYTGTYDITKMVLHCAGKNIQWTEQYKFTQDANGVKSTTINAVEPSTNQYVCNVDMTGQNTLWLVTQNGLMSGQTLSANGVNLNRFVSNGAGSQNMAFFLNATGTITLP